MHGEVHEVFIVLLQYRKEYFVHTFFVAFVFPLITSLPFSVLIFFLKPGYAYLLMRSHRIMYETWHSEVGFILGLFFHSFFV